MAREIKRKRLEPEGKAISGRSELTQWPIQLHLVSPFAPYFQNADLLVAADCTAFSFGSFHPGDAEGKKLVIACPKLDDTEGYVEKLAEIIKRNDRQVPERGHYDRSLLFRALSPGRGGRGSFRACIEPKKIVVGIDGKIIQAEHAEQEHNSSGRG